MRVFLDDTDYRKFLYLLGDVVEEYDVDCWEVCVMPNHYHLAVMNRQPNLPEAMQQLNGEYALWWNARHGRVGHVFQGRYKDQIVQHDAYLLNLVRYIALNPVRARLVDSPEQWPWSSFAGTAGLAPTGAFVCSEPVLAAFGEGDLARLRERYRCHVLQGLRLDDEVHRLFRARQRTVGDRAFRQQVKRVVAASCGAAEPARLAQVIPELQ